MLIIFLFAGCRQEEELPQLEQEEIVEIDAIRQWFDTNRTSLRNEATDIRAREMTKALILPFLEKEPDWSKFSVYQFNDGRKVYEIHLKNLSGIMPKEFFERFGSSGNDLIEESLLFVEKANGDLGYSVLVARYYSYGEKSEGMTYHKIPSHWSGRIDMFSYAEEHLRSFEVEEGNLISHIRYEMKEESNKSSNLGRSLMTHCIGYWIDFPYYGNGIYHVYSHQSIYVQHCWDMPTAPDGPSTDPNHDEGSPSGGGGSGAGSYGGVGPSPTYGIDDPLNYCNGPDCFPFPEEEGDGLDDDCNSFEERVSHVLNTEGGFVNDPIDKGGPTNRGISWDVWLENAQNILGKQPTLTNLENLSADDAKKIYKVKYWDKIYLDNIEDGDLRWLIFDFYVNSGGNAIIVLQKELNNMGHNLNIDGGMGPNTINAINSSNVIDLYNNFIEGRRAFYENLVQKDIDRYLKKHPNASENELRDKTQLKFKNGWMNRINSFIEKTIQNFNNVNC